MNSEAPDPGSVPPPWRSLRGWPRLVFSFRAAGAGFLTALRTQQNFRLHVAAAVLVLAAGLLLRVSTVEGSLLAICIGSVMAAELFNTALEKLVDLACPHIDERARFIKDVCAAAVLMCTLMSVIVGLLILGPRLWIAMSGAS